MHSPPRVPLTPVPLTPVPASFLPVDLRTPVPSASRPALAPGTPARGDLLALPPLDLSGSFKIPNRPAQTKSQGPARKRSCRSPSPAQPQKQQQHQAVNNQELNNDKWKLNEQDQPNGVENIISEIAQLKTAIYNIATQTQNQI